MITIKKQGSEEMIIRASKLALCIVLVALVVGASVDVIETGHSGYPNHWRDMRHGIGLLVSLVAVTLLVASPKQNRWLNVLMITATIVWLAIDLTWPRV